MKIVYYNRHDEKLFEIQIDKLDSVKDEDLIKDDNTPITDYHKKILNHLNEEIFLFKPINDGEDFSLEFFNYIDYVEKDYNFKIGSLISQTFGHNDKENNLLNMLREVYTTGVEQHGIVKYLTNEGKLFKSLDFRYFMMDTLLAAIHEDKTEVRMYRESMLNNKDLGVAIYQNNRFVEVNEKYAKTVSKTREQLLGVEQDLRGVPEEMVEVIKKEIAAIARQEKRSYKMPMVSYDENGDIRYYINAEGSYITYDNMPALLFKIRDLTQQERAKRLNATNADKKIRVKSTIDELGQYSKTFIAYVIHPINKAGVSEHFYTTIEDDAKDYVFTKDSIRELTMGDDLDIYDSMISSLSPTNTDIEFTTSMMTLKLNVRYVRHYFKRIYDEEGNIRADVSVHHDITDEVSYYNSLKKQIYDKNEVIKNKDVQIKEAHHTIKNNLNILLSLIRMEELYNKESAEIIDDTKSHLKAISVMHENLYKSKNLEDIELKDYVDSIVESLFEIYSSDIKYISHVDDITLNADQAGTLGLILNELVNNTVKHAFPDNNFGSIQIKISRVDKILEVEYKDSGVGIPDTVDFENPTSLGLMLVRNLTEQLDGEVEYIYDNGACFKIEFKETESF